MNPLKPYNPVMFSEIKYGDYIHGLTSPQLRVLEKLLDKRLKDAKITEINGYAIVGHDESNNVGEDI